MFKNIKNWFKRQKHEDFMEAVVAACALVAAADGTIEDSEKGKMAEFIQQSEELNVFPLEKIVVSFNKFADVITFNIKVGKEEALKAIRKIKNQPEMARSLIRVCCSVGQADGNFDNDEKKVVSELCTELGFNPDYYKAFYLKFK